MGEYLRSEDDKNNEKWCLLKYVDFVNRKYFPIYINIFIYIKILYSVNNILLYLSMSTKVRI